MLSYKRHSAYHALVHHLFAIKYTCADESCPLQKTNGEEESFYTSASVMSHTSHMALIGSGLTWAPGIKDTVYW